MKMWFAIRLLFMRFALAGATAAAVVVAMYTNSDGVMFGDVYIF